MKEEFDYIIIGNCKIYEPAVVATSSIIFLLSLIFSFAIKNPQNKKYIHGWKMFFLYMALGAFIGCFFHGVQKQWGERMFSYLNLARNCCLLLSAVFAFKGTLFYVSKNEGLLARINTFLIVYILAAIIVTVILNHFLIVIINAAIFIVYILVAHIRSYRGGNKASGWILGAFAIAPLPITVHLLKLGYGKFLNPKDIAHFFIWISLALIYKGVKEMNKTA